MIFSVFRGVKLIYYFYETGKQFVLNQIGKGKYEFT